MRDAGRCAAEVLDLVKTHVAPGVTTWELDQIAKQAMDKLGAKSAAFGYGGPENPFPSHICISRNEQVVHGFRKKDVILELPPKIENNILCIFKCLKNKIFIYLYYTLILIFSIVIHIGTNIRECISNFIFISSNMAYFIRKIV